MYLAHYGTKNMKWGVRKYQNEDGTLTPAGKERYRNMMPTSARDAMNGKTETYRRKVDAVRIRPYTEYDKNGNKISSDTYNVLTGYGRQAIKPTNDNPDETVYAKGFMTNMYGYDGMPTSAREANYEATERKMEKRIYNKIIKTSSGMPTSAIKAQNEAKIKASIPASAWNQRASALNQTSKSKVSKEYKQEVAYNTGTQMPSASKADVNKKPNNASSEYWAERDYNSKKNSWR